MDHLIKYADPSPGARLRELYYQEGGENWAGLDAEEDRALRRLALEIVRAGMLLGVRESIGIIREAIGDFWRLHKVTEVGEAIILGLDAYIKEPPWLQCEACEGLGYSDISEASPLGDKQCSECSGTGEARRH